MHDLSQAMFSTIVLKLYEELPSFTIAIGHNLKDLNSFGSCYFIHISTRCNKLVVFALSQHINFSILKDWQMEMLSLTFMIMGLYQDWNHAWFSDDFKNYTFSMHIHCFNQWYLHKTMSQNLHMSLYAGFKVLYVYRWFNVDFHLVFQIYNCNTSIGLLISRMKLHLPTFLWNMFA